jgi:hypothetical protein
MARHSSPSVNAGPSRHRSSNRLADAEPPRQTSARWRSRSSAPGVPVCTRLHHYETGSDEQGPGGGSGSAVNSTTEPQAREVRQLAATLPRRERDSRSTRSWKVPEQAIRSFRPRDILLQIARNLTAFVRKPVSTCPRSFVRRTCARTTGASQSGALVDDGARRRGARTRALRRRGVADGRMTGSAIWDRRSLHGIRKQFRSARESRQRWQPRTGQSSALLGQRPGSAFLARRSSPGFGRSRSTSIGSRRHRW